MANEVRIQAYIDSHLSQLVNDYAADNKLTISKAVSQLLADALSSSQKSPIQFDLSNYVTKVELEDFKELMRSQLFDINDAAVQSYDHLEAMITSQRVINPSQLSNPSLKPSKSHGFGRL